MMRAPAPDESTEVNDSTSPSYTFTVVDVARLTSTSTCSSPSACPSTVRASSVSSAMSVPSVLRASTTLIDVTALCLSTTTSSSTIKVHPGRLPREVGQVGADRHHVAEHALQGRADRDLSYAFGELAAADAHALGTDGQVARHRVHARVQAGDVVHQEALADLGDDLVGGSLAGGEGHDVRADAGRRSWAPTLADPVDTVPEARAV